MTIQDASGNTVTSASNSVALAITSGTGVAGATLGGTLAQVAFAGVSNEVWVLTHANGLP